MVQLRALLVAAALPSLASAGVTLVSFADGSSESKWVAESDPVMGGVSNSNVTIASDHLAFRGEVKIVPSLAAPGFCLTYSTSPKAYADASAFASLTVRARSSVPYAGFKAAFSTKLHPSTQFAMFKADFTNPLDPSGDWTDVIIPFTNFTYSWSSYTGEPIITCAVDPKYCPTPTDLSTIRSLEVWAEGVEGKFEIDIESFGAM